MCIVDWTTVVALQTCRCFGACNLFASDLRDVVPCQTMRRQPMGRWRVGLVNNECCRRTVREDRRDAACALLFSRHDHRIGDTPRRDGRDSSFLYRRHRSFTGGDAFKHGRRTTHTHRRFID